MRIAVSKPRRRLQPTLRELHTTTCQTQTRLHEAVGTRVFPSWRSRPKSTILAKESLEMGYEKCSVEPPIASRTPGFRVPMRSGDRAPFKR